MPKQKTHRQTVKVLNVRPGGTITHKRAGGNHNTGMKSMKSNRSIRKGSTLSESYRKKFKNII